VKSHSIDGSALKDLIHMYQVSFVLQSSDTAICGRAAEVTLRLELRGRHDGQCSGVFCLGCNHVLRVLFEVADALRAFEREAFKRAAYAYQNNAGSGSGQRCNREVVLGLEMSVRRPFARASGGWGWRFLDRLTAALTKLGCRDRSTDALSGTEVYVGRFKTQPAKSKESRAPLEV